MKMVIIEGPSQVGLISELFLGLLFPLTTPVFKIKSTLNILSHSIYSARCVSLRCTAQ